MGCLLCYEEPAATHTSRHTDPDACIPPFEIPFDTAVTLAPQENLSGKKKRDMIRPSRAEKVLGRIDRGVHLLQKGISIAQGAYTIGRTLAPLAASMV